MKAFEFRLQRVTEFRQQQLDAAKNRLHVLSSAMQQLEEESVSLEQRRNEAGDNIAARVDLKGEDVLALASFQEYLSRRENIIKREKIDLASKIEQQRAEVIEAERKVKLLDRLKDRRFQEWKIASDRELDELAADSYLARLSSQRATSSLRIRST